MSVNVFNNGTIASFITLHQALLLSTELKEKQRKGKCDGVDKREHYLVLKLIKVYNISKIFGLTDKNIKLVNDILKVDLNAENNYWCKKILEECKKINLNSKKETKLDVTW